MHSSANVSQCSILRQIQAHSADISSAGLRLLLFLAVADEAPRTQKELAAGASVSRSSVQRALVELEEAGHLTVDGPATAEGSLYRLGRVFNLNQPPVDNYGSGFNLNQPPVDNYGSGFNLNQPPVEKRLQFESTLPQFEASPVQFEHPFDLESTTYEPDIKVDARASIDSFISYTESIDRANPSPKKVDADTPAQRIETASPAKEDPEQLREASALLLDFAARRRPGGAPAPDSKIVAQVLAVAKVEELGRTLVSLFRENRVAGETYAWFVTVLADRLHGVRSGALQAARQRYRDRRPPRKPPQYETSVEFMSGFHGQLRSAAAGKSLR